MYRPNSGTSQLETDQCNNIQLQPLKQNYVLFEFSQHIEDNMNNESLVGVKLPCTSQGQRAAVHQTNEPAIAKQNHYEVEAVGYKESFFTISI